MKPILLLLIVCSTLNTHKAQCQNIHHHPMGISWKDATIMCGEYGLEYNQEILRNNSKLYGKEFWIGTAYYDTISPWIELLGCHSFDRLSSPITASSVAYCQTQCNTNYFAFKKATKTCICITDTDFGHLEEFQPCTNVNILVYKKFENAYESSPNVEKCMVSVCSNGGMVKLYESNCDGSVGVQGLCEGGVAPKESFWDKNWNSSLQTCMNEGKILLSSMFCPQNGLPAWVNIFRENIKLVLPYERSLKNPLTCSSGSISRNSLSYNTTWVSCTEIKLEWFVCRNDTDKMTSNENSMENSDISLIIGILLLAVIVIIIIAVVLLCTNRWFPQCIKKPLQDKTSQPKDSQELKINYSGFDHSNKTLDPTPESEYSISQSGVYDRLNATDRRKKNLQENLYSSNVNDRSKDDQDYNIAQHVRQNNGTDDYSHWFVKHSDDSDYDVAL